MDHVAQLKLAKIMRNANHPEKRPAIIELVVHWQYVRNEKILIPRIRKTILAFAVTSHHLVTSRRNFCMPTSCDINLETYTQRFDTGRQWNTVAELDAYDERMAKFSKFVKGGSWVITHITWAESEEMFRLDDDTEQSSATIDSEYVIVGKYFKEYDMITMKARHEHHRVELSFPGISEQGRCFGVAKLSTARQRVPPHEEEGGEDRTQTEMSDYFFPVGTWVDRGSGLLPRATSLGRALSAGSPISIEVGSGGDLKVIGANSGYVGGLRVGEVDLYLNEFTPSTIVLLLLCTIYGNGIQSQIKGKGMELSDIPLADIPKVDKYYTRPPQEYLEGLYVETKLDRYCMDIFRKTART